MKNKQKKIKNVGIRNTGCAPAIWRKLGPVQKMLFNVIYPELIEAKEVLYPSNTKVSDKSHEITAHNTALTIIWLIPDVLDRFFKN